jgi:hypothetical protein
MNPDPERTLRAALAGIGAFAVGYLLPGTLQLPVLVYDPAARAFSIARVVQGVSMRYYGDLLVACAAGLFAAAAAWALRPRRTPIAVAAGTALTLVALDVAFYLSRLLAAV